MNGDKAGAQQIALDLTFSDTGERYGLRVENAVLHHARDRIAPAATPVTLTRAALVGLVLGETELEAAIEQGAVTTADPGPLGTLLALLDRFDFWFELVMP